jgi:ligand-binding sensor domain-containing protein/signal transduction histidine kinase
LLQACRESTRQDAGNISPLYLPPLSVSLDTVKGYAVNPISGDSIKPLVNSLGDSIQTGIPLLLKGKEIDAKLLNPKTIYSCTAVISTPATNTYPVQGKPEIIPADNYLTQTDTDNKTGNSINNYESLIKERMIPAVGVSVPLRAPQPLKVSPMAVKDNATTDIQYLDIAQGLPYSYILDIIEDKNGFIWLAVDGYGVCKYDGVYLTSYTQKEGLIDNRVTSLMEDDKGNIWIGTKGGISVFDGHNFTQFTEKGGLPDEHIIHFDKGTKGTIWVNTEGGSLTKFDGQHFIIYSEKERSPHNKSTACLEDNQGRTWIANYWGIALFDGKKFISFHNELDFLTGVYSIVEDNNGNTWFGSTTKGLTKYDGESFTRYTKENGLTDNSIMQLMKDKKGNIWIATRNGGIMKFDGMDFTVYSKEQGLSDDKTSTIMEDSRSNIWITTFGGGINKLNCNGFSQKILLKDLGNSRVRPMMKDKNGNLWFGTEAGRLYQYNGTNLKTYFSDKNFGWHSFRSMMADAKGNFWFGEAEGGGIYKYSNNRFTYYSLGIDWTSNLSLFEAGNGTVWIGKDQKGAIAFNGMIFTNYTEEQGFPSNRVFVTAEDRKRNLWFGTDAGLVKFDGKFFTTISARQGFFGKGVTSIIEDKQGNLWLGTLGAGLCKFNGLQFTYYTENQGLSCNDVWSVMQDSTGQIWAGTDKGLSLLVPRKDSLQTYSVNNFGLEDGLKATDFNLHSVCIDNNNRIWWGTGKGLVSRDLNESFTTVDPRSLSLNQISINGQFYDFRNLPDSMSKKISFSNIPAFSNCPDKLVLAYDQNHLTFHFTAIDWQAPHKLQYSYRLVGLDNTWSMPSGATMAEFRNLPHGKYELQVKAIGQSQTWTTAMRYSFTILPPWWLTWWFKALIIAVTAVLLFVIIRFIYRYQFRKQKATLEKQLAVQYERQRISAEMHDDIGAGLSGIRLLTEMTKNKVKDEQAAEEVEKIYQSVGDISSKMKEVIWSLNTENDNLGNLLSYLQKQARQMMENYPGSFLMNMPQSVPELKIGGETRRHIYLAVKEALHNIIKHSGADKVQLDISCDDKLVIIVADNGKGMNTSQSSSSGNGLKNMRTRMEKIGGKFSAENKDGLTLIFEIPLKTIL